MALINLKTDLKSLKYGLDRPNLGNSKEPFITKPIPDERPVDIPDFILRDGALKRGFEDISRLTQLFTTVRGLRFIANTNLLAAQNPKIPGAPRNLYLPTNTLAQAGVSAIGTHLNFLGETPFDLPSTNISLGNLSLNLGGETYFKEYKNNFSQPEDNRLVILARKKIGLERSNQFTLNEVLDVSPDKALKYGVALLDEGLILNYIGGPGAGITGLNTTIKRTEFTVGSKGYSGTSIDKSKNKSRDSVNESVSSLNLTELLGASNYYYSLTEINGERVPDIDLENDLGINVKGSQLNNFGPQSSNDTLSTLKDSSKLIEDSLKFSKNESNNAKTSINGNNLLGVSLKEDITGSTGFNEEGQQIKTFGPQDNNDTLSKISGSEALINESKQISSNVTSLKTLSSYTSLIGASRVYDERNSVRESSTAPFTNPGIDKSGFNEEGQQLKRYGPLDNNIVPDGDYLDYRYQGTPALRENKNSSLYEVGRQGQDDMIVSPTSPYGQTFFPNYEVINSPFGGDKDFNTIRNEKDHFNRYNTERLNLSRFENDKTKTLTSYLKGADGRSSNGEFINNGQLFSFILNLINAESPQDNQYLYWQAYIDTFSDRIEASYDNYEYPGYGTSFYKYKSFNREINLDFTIEVPHPDQMKTIYSKLQELIRHLAPNYSQGGYLRGNFVKLTFGDYLVNTPCILKGFSIEPIFDGGFDIGRTGFGSRGPSSGYQLPKVIKLNGFNFIVLADNNNEIIKSTSTFISNKDKSLD